jgi:hypothetical protein
MLHAGKVKRELVQQHAPELLSHSTAQHSVGRFLVKACICQFNEAFCLLHPAVSLGRCRKCDQALAIGWSRCGLRNEINDCLIAHLPVPQRHFCQRHNAHYSVITQLKRAILLR